MKRLFALILTFVCLVSSASASRSSFLQLKYNAAARTIGAYSISGINPTELSVFEMRDSYAFDFDAYTLVFIFSGDDVKNINIRAKDEALIGEFFLACMSVIVAFGGFNQNAFGVLMYQYSRIKTGSSINDPCYVGQDAFQLIAGTDGYLYSFTYLNSDLSYFY